MDEPKILAHLSPILSGKECPYCGQATIYAEGKTLLGKSYGMIYLCAPCSAWVGVHQGTTTSLGSLANAELRELRMQAHRWFDPIAIEGMIDDIEPLFRAGMNNRRKAYLWLASQLGIREEYCHIAMFNPTECLAVIQLCQPLVEAIIEKTTRDLLGQ